MKKAISNFSSFIIAATIVLLCAPASAETQEKAQAPEENFYAKSLHYTNKGIEYVYAKEQGGVERITGIPAAQLGCLQAKCHVRTCDTCHKKEIDGKAFYSTEQARTHESCNKCHPVEKDDPDAHFKKGMKCMNCHTAREIHGDGVAYNSYMQKGFFDARCEKCHAKITQSASHTVHNGKLDCSTCHVLEFPTCLNCHYETRIKEKKDASFTIKGTYFLVNHDGKVKLASFLTHAYQNRTMITVAPYFPHSITKEGKKCKDCHDSSIIQAIKNGTFKPFIWENGEMKNIKGIVPILDGMKWDLVWLTKEEDKWIPLKNPVEPLINYAGSCTPLTNEQFNKLATSR